MATPFPWQPGPDTPANLSAQLDLSGDLAKYSHGFHLGASLLVDQVEADQVPADLLVYKVVYSLRHAVELALKQILLQARGYLDGVGEFPDGHDLLNLWRQARRDLSSIWDDPDASERVERVVNALKAIDPNGEGFRYPVTTRSKKTGGERAGALDPDLAALDLQVLYDDVTEALELLVEAGDALVLSNSHHPFKAKTTGSDTTGTSEDSAQPDPPGV